MQSAGELLAELTVEASAAGCEELLAWARKLGSERIFALEDCRLLSAPLERLLLASGERCLRVPARLTARTRRRSRRRGKSDEIDAACVARCALAEPDLPAARLPGVEEDVRLLSAHRGDLVAERTRLCQRLRWHLVALDLPLKVPPRRLSRRRAGLRASQAELADLAGMRARIVRELAARCRELNREIARLERELDRLTDALAPGLRALPGCGPLSAATLLGETAGAMRFASDARFAMFTGYAHRPAGLEWACSCAATVSTAAQPAPERRPASHRHHPTAEARTGALLRRTAHGRRQELARGDEMPEAASGAGGLSGAVP